MTWDSLVAVESETLRQDHGLAQARAETRAWEHVKHYYGVSYRQGHRAGWWQAVEYVLTAQTRWDELTEGEAITELRKGQGSIFYPLFKDNPRVWVDCPRDGRVTVNKEGTCDRCLLDFSED